MSSRIHCFVAWNLLCLAAFAQRDRRLDVLPVPAPPQHVGVYDVAHHRWVDPARQLVIVSNGNWNKAGSANNPSYAAREDFYQAVQKAVDDEAAAAPKQ